MHAFLKKLPLSDHVSAAQNCSTLNIRERADLVGNDEEMAVAPERVTAWDTYVQAHENVHQEKQPSVAGPAATAAGDRVSAMVASATAAGHRVIAAGQRTKARIADHAPHLDTGDIGAAAAAGAGAGKAGLGAAVAAGRRAGAALGSAGKEAASCTAAAGRRVSTAVASHVDKDRIEAAAASGKARAGGAAAGCCRARATFATAAGAAASDEAKRAPLLVMCGCLLANVVAVATPIVNVGAASAGASGSTGTGGGGSVYMFQGASGSGATCALLTLAALLLLGATIGLSVVEWGAWRIILALAVAR